MSSHHDSEGKPKRDSKVLSLTPSSNRKYDLNVHADRERFVQEVVVYFTTWHKKLRELKPQIVIVQGLFSQHVRGSVTLCGCRSFKEFCVTKLGVKSEQTVYAMLGNYSEKSKAKAKQRVPKGERERDDEIPREAVMRMRTALEKVQQARHAETDAEKAAAWREFDEIAEAQPLPSAMRSKIVDDQPDYQRLLRDVLLAALQLHAALSNIVKAGILEEDSALLMATRAALDAGKMLAAVRKRLNIDQPTVQ
jgi:hypothetical protein